MFAQHRVWLSAGIAGLLIGTTGSAPMARDGVRSIPLASVATVPDTRNIADIKPTAIDIPRARPAGERSEVSVTVDRAKLIRLPEKTQTVVIGNPSVADIAVQKNGVVVLTGKSFGVTNFIALDSQGGMIGESMVSVVAPTDGTLTVQRGLERQTYSCTPICQPSVTLGDSTNVFAETKGQVDQHSAFSTQR
jgi:Flp pilus assembly secretin CpaC